MNTRNDRKDPPPAQPSTVEARARTLRRKAVRGVITGLSALEARFGRPAWIASLAGPGAEKQAERLRDVIDRDRALHAARPRAQREPAEPAVAVPADTAEAPSPAEPLVAAPASTPEPPVCEEPIRTRTMARLLATQGHPERALGIYRWLLAQTPEDDALRAEIAALEAHAR